MIRVKTSRTKDSFLGDCITVFICAEEDVHYQVKEKIREILASYFDTRYGAETLVSLKTEQICESLSLIGLYALRYGGINHIFTLEKTKEDICSKEDNNPADLVRDAMKKCNKEIHSNARFRDFVLLNKGKIPL
jgi:hypothetical protein